MSWEDIVKRILSDAEAEAADIIRTAGARADEIVAKAEAAALKEREDAEADVVERSKRIQDGKAAAARLDSAKVLLAEKRRVIEEIYARALEKLLNLGEHDSLSLLERLLKENAEEGDEIVLAENFKYVAGVFELPVVFERKLIISKERAPISGGCILHGKVSDKDLSYSALLAADMEEYQADLAAKLFVS